MAPWTCPKCHRVFAKKNQSHLVCEEALSLEDYFGQANPWEQPIFEAIANLGEGRTQSWTEPVPGMISPILVAG